MKNAVNLAWLTVGLADVALGYFAIYKWAYWHSGGIVIALIGLVIAVDAVRKLRRPKVYRALAYAR